MSKFYFILFFLLSKITKEEEIEMFEIAKASACLALSKYEINKNNIKNKQEIFDGLINCYYSINEEQLITLVDLIKNDNHDFKNTIFEGLANGKNFIKNFPDSNDRKEKMIKFQKVLNGIKTNQEKYLKDKNKKTNNKENSNSVGGIKFLVLKGILNVFKIVNNYVIFGIGIVFLFFTLKNCSRLCSKKKINNNKSKKM
jgi:hypothetical protein